MPALPGKMSKQLSKHGSLPAFSINSKFNQKSSANASSKIELRLSKEKEARAAEFQEIALQEMLEKTEKKSKGKKFEKEAREKFYSAIHNRFP